jgi:hypothetical protein
VNRKEVKDAGDIREIKLFEQNSKTVLLTLKFSGEKVLEYEARTVPPLKSIKVIPQVNFSLLLKKMLDPEHEKLIKHRKGFVPFAEPGSLGDIYNPRGEGTLSKNVNERETNLYKRANVIDLDIPYIGHLPVIDYDTNLNEEDKNKIKKDVEGKAYTALSNGKCSFKDDINFLEFWSGRDPLIRFQGNNFKPDKEKDENVFQPIVNENYIPLYRFESILESFGVFESIFYEVIYHLWSSDYAKYIFPKYDTYKSDGGTIFREHRLNYVTPEFQKIEKFLASLLNEVFEYAHNCFDSLHFYYLPSLRSSTSRVFSKSTTLSLFDEAIKEFYELEYDFNKVEKSFLHTWLKNFSLGDDLIVERPESTVSVIYLKRGNKKVNLADLGYGTTQLLPIIMKILTIARKTITDDEPDSVYYSPSICIIEEPESNLHPNFESLLADMIVDAADRFRIQFIIETHSEYLIRKLQYLTAKSVIKTEDTVIYYFNGENVKGKEKVKKIEIKKDGRLSSEFGPGFYDESTRLMMSLFTDDIMN